MKGAESVSGYTYNKEYAKKYLKNQDELKIRIPKGRKADIEAHAKARGESVNGLVNGLIRADMGLTEEQWKRREEQSREGAEE